MYRSNNTRWIQTVYWKDGALESFQKIIVEPTSVEETITILNNIKNKYEDHHNVIYSQEALKPVSN
jgi:ATP-dependent Clp protease ATP-binding subunit ClpC